MKNSLTRLLVIIVLTVVSLTVYSQPVNQVFEEWVTADGTQNYFIKAAVETDADGYTYVAGATLNGDGNYDLLVTKYGDGGEVIWTDQYDGTGNGDDAAVALVVDANGYVFVTGTTFTSSTDTLDVVTIGYDDTGNRDWLEVYSGADELADFATCIAVTNNAVYVGGSTTSATTGLDFLALKYNLSGVLQWDTPKDYNSLSDVCTKLTVGDKDLYLAGATNTTGFDWDMVTMSFIMSDGTFGSDATASGGSVGFAHVRAMDRDLDGNIYLTGTVANMSTGYDIHTVKIDTFMNVLWDVDYSSSGNHDDEGNALAIDPSNGNVYVGGFKDVSGQGTDFVTLMYNDAGSLQWSAMWNDTADGGDTVKALVVDANGNVTVTGSAWNGSSLDYHTVQYDDTGTLLWEHSFNDKYNFTDAPMDIALTSDNGVVVTGQSLNPDSTWSYVTVKYLAHEFILFVDSDSVSTSLRWLTNRDQLLDTDTNLVERVKYYSNQCYPNLHFMDDTLSYVFFQGVDTSNADTLHRIDMTFKGANADQKLLPMDKESYWNNYYLGHIPEGRPFVSLHDRLVKQDVWPNIDVVYSSNQRGLKYYIVVHPGGETGAISLEYHGYDALSVDGNNALVIESSIGELVQPQALAYEMDANGELDLLGWQPKYKVTSGEVVFEDFGDWGGDLVIEVNWGYGAYGITRTDNLYWSTFFGGAQNDHGTAVCVGSSSVVYNSGQTESTHFPVLNEIQSTLRGFSDIYVAAFNSSAERLWATYYGGTSEESPSKSIAAVNNGVICSGQTSSGDFPRSSPSGKFLQSTIGGFLDAFILALNQNGIRTWATFFGGSGTDVPNSIVADGNGGIYLGGRTNSTTPDNSAGNGTTLTVGSFPLSDPSGANDYFQISNEGFNGFIAYFANTSWELEWSTYFGGGDVDNILDLAVDFENGDLYISGETRSPTVPSNVSSPCGANVTGAFPLCNPSNGAYFQNHHPNGASLDCGFIAQFSVDHALEWSSYFGGTGNHSVAAIGIASNHQLYATGKSTSGSLSTSCTALSNGDFPLCNLSGIATMQSTYGGSGDNFITRFGSNHDLKWSSLIGGNTTEHSAFYGSSYRGGGDLDVAIDQLDNVFVMGSVTIPLNTPASPGGNFPNLPCSTYGNWYDQPDFGNIGEVNSSGDAFLVGYKTDNIRFWSTLFGGARNTGGSNTNIVNGSEYGASIAIDGTEYLYLTGSTGSPFTPISKPTSTAFCQTSLNGPATGTLTDAYLSRFSIAGITVSNFEIHSNKYMENIYPNPTRDKFYISLDLERPKAITILVWNQVGQLVDRYSATHYPADRDIEFDLSGEASGIYIVQILFENNNHYGKVFKY